MLQTHSRESSVLLRLAQYDVLDKGRISARVYARLEALNYDVATLERRLLERKQ